eukprot:TRINITY_DN17548_c0_g1_i1.p1 TRINITY_DN17548_c0_g1~~TRINITY_DN17548_c0_g1_i1.p1  ORF type:complete len:356 (-),score=105.39 TRINITY_DN17548_c0_g1_i1:61-999(-)
MAVAGGDAKARDLLLQAEKKMKSWFGGDQKFEEAADMFAKAGNLYKVSKNMNDAGHAYCRAAECQLKLKSNHDAANHYVSAAGCLKKTNVAEAANCLRLAIDLLVDAGKFGIAARHQQELAELYEQDNDLENAMLSYERAADFFEGDNAISRANPCLLKVASHAAQLEKYDDAIALFEKVATTCLDSNLLKWGAKDHFFRAGLCHFAKGDTVGARRAIQNYQNQDVSFGSQRECKFLLQIADAFESYDLDAFTNAVVEFDAITKLDPWKTTVLMRIKTRMREESGAVEVEQKDDEDVISEDEGEGQAQGGDS